MMARCGTGRTRRCRRWAGPAAGDCQGHGPDGDSGRDRASPMWSVRSSRSH